MLHMQQQDITTKLRSYAMSRSRYHLASRLLSSCLLFDSLWVAFPTPGPPFGCHRRTLRSAFMAGKWYVVREPSPLKNVETVTVNHANTR